MQTFAVIPAAGRSQRMGRPKLLMPWGERTVIERVLGVWRASQVSAVVLVVHPQDRELADLGQQAGAAVVVPAAPPAEMKASVRLGLARIERDYAPGASDAWLLAPADMPTLTTAAIDRVIDAYRASREGAANTPVIWAPTFDGRRGHPVLFSWSLAGEVDRLAVDEGLNALVARFPVREVAVEAAAILEDFDTPDDYERLQGSAEP